MRNTLQQRMREGVARDEEKRRGMPTSFLRFSSHRGLDQAVGDVRILPCVEGDVAPLQDDNGALLFVDGYSAAVEPSGEGSGG